MIKKPLVREFSAGGIVVRKDKTKLKYLLIKDSYGKWALPKGHIEENESAEAAAKREIQEETGISNLRTVEELTPVKYFFQNEGDLIYKIVRFFLFEAKGDEQPKPDGREVKDAKFLPLAEAIELSDYRNTKEILQKLSQGKSYGRPR